MNKHVITVIAFSGLALALTGCNQAESTAPATVSSGRNNSDLSKSSYRPMDTEGRAYQQHKVEMLKKIDSQWANHLAQSSTTAVPALAKVATSGKVGFLQNYSWGTTNSTNLEVYMDTENDGNADSLTYYGSSVNQTQILGVKRISTQHGGTLFHFWTPTLTSLTVLKYDYIALLLSASCPTNGLRFGEIFDNEDTDNQDSASPSVDPGWSRKDWTGTRLEFCFVPGNNALSTNVVPDWYGDDRGAFGLPGLSYYSGAGVTYPCSLNPPQTSRVLMDGEDDGWAGSFDWESLPSADTTKVKAIMNNLWGAPTLNITECHIPD